MRVYIEYWPAHVSWNWPRKCPYLIQLWVELTQHFALVYTVKHHVLNMLHEGLFIIKTASCGYRVRQGCKTLSLHDHFRVIFAYPALYVHLMLNEHFRRIWVQLCRTVSPQKHPVCKRQIFCSLFPHNHPQDYLYRPNPLTPFFNLLTSLECSSDLLTFWFFCFLGHALQPLSFQEINFNPLLVVASWFYFAFYSK